MSWFISIVRTGRPITVDDLRTCVAEMPELALGDDEEGPVLTVWRAGGLTAGMVLDDGELSAQNPETDVLAVMIALAERLGGRVRGPEGETFRTPFETYLHPDDQEERDAVRRRERGRKARRWLLRALPWVVVGGIVAARVPWLWPAPLTEPGSPTDRVRRELTPGAADVLVMPADDFNEAVAARLAARLAELTGLRVKPTTALGTGDLSTLPDSDQYDADRLLALARPIADALRRQYGSGFAIVLTSKDLNTADRALNFLFARHDVAAGLTVVAASRLVRGGFTAYASDRTIEERLLKFMLRAVGTHIYRLDRTTDKANVMYSPIMSLDDVDSMGLRLDRP